MGAGGMFRMVLHRKSRIAPMAHSFKAAVIEIDMGQFNGILVKGRDINGKTMILRGDFDMTGGQILDWLIAAAMTEL